MLSMLSRIFCVLQNGKSSEILKLCEEEGLHQVLSAALLMQENETLVCEDAVHSLLQLCIKKKDLKASHLMHCFVASMGLESIGAFGDTLTRIFALCGSLHKAYEIFCKIMVRTVYSWNTIISAHIDLEACEKGLELYCKMKEESIKPDKFTFLALLKSCKELREKELARVLHEHIMRCALETDKLIGSTLIDTYTKCGCLEDAYAVFKRLVGCDLVSWNAMISGCVMHGDEILALELFEKMHQNGIKPNEVTFAFILKACGNAEAMRYCMLVHDNIIQEGLELDTMVWNGTVDMYTRCGDLKTAQSLFGGAKNQSVVSWNIMIARYVQNGSFVVALEYFEKMLVLASPDTYTFSCVLQACGSLGSLKHGNLIHSLIVSFGLEVDVGVKRMLVDMYAKCGNLYEARTLSCSLQHYDAASWTSILAGYVRHGDASTALCVFEDMLQEHFSPTDVTYSWVLKACAGIGDLTKGKLVHDMMIRSGMEINEVTGSALISMYTTCRSLPEGQQTFGKIAHKDLVLWNTLISGYVEAGEVFPVFVLFDRMQSKGIKPDNYTFSCVLKACTELGDIKTGRLMHDQMVKSYTEFDLVLGNTLIDMYAKLGSLEESIWVFFGLSSRDTVSWNSLLAGYAQQERGLFAMELFGKMMLDGVELDKSGFSCVLKVCSSFGALKEGKMIHDMVIKRGFESNLVVESKLVDMYVKCGSLWEGCSIFDKMHTRNLVAWNAAIGGYVVHGDAVLAIELFVRMQAQGNEPDMITYVAVLRACVSLGAVEYGRLVHVQIVENVEADLILSSALIDMYGKCGSTEDASNVYDCLPSLDIAAWNAMISAYAQQGDCLQIERCLAKMQRHNLKPDAKTYSSVLAACSRTGKAKEGYQHFKSMTEKHGILPTVEHVTCMVDLLGRTGQLHAAEELLDVSPAFPETAGWRALLSACRTHGGMAPGGHSYSQAVLSDPLNSGGYVLMSNIYMDASMCGNACEIQGQRMYHGAWKKPGRACIEVQSCMHEFVVGGSNHLETIEIFAKVRGLSRNLDEEGYVPQVGLVLPLVSDETVELSLPVRNGTQ